MTKEEFIKAGYVNFGYISPELSSKDTYPEYIKENVTEAIEKIKKIQNEKTVTFAFMTDIHYSSTENHDIRTKRLMNAYEEIKNAVGIKMLILGGDYINDGTKEYKINNYRAFREYLKNEKWFPVNGNHDDNSIWDECIENETSENHLTTEEMYDEFFSHLPNQNVKFGKDGKVLYYYFDDAEDKIRYICIDASDIPYSVDEKGKLNYVKQHLYAISQEQINWLTNEALVFDEEGFSVVFIAHTFPRWTNDEDAEYDNLRFLEPLGDIIDSFNSGSDIEKKYFENEFENIVKADFSKYKRANVIACFGGHYHADFEQYSKTSIPFIYTGNVMMYKYRVPRIDGDKSELLFDVVTIDKENRTIYTTRVGVGENRKIPY